MEFMSILVTGNETVHIIWTDFTKTIVFGKCFNGDHRMFSVWSKEPMIEHHLLDTIEIYLTQFGYTPENFEVQPQRCVE